MGLRRRSRIHRRTRYSGRAAAPLPGLLGPGLSRKKREFHRGLRRTLQPQSGSRDGLSGVSRPFRRDASVGAHADPSLGRSRLHPQTLHGGAETPDRRIQGRLPGQADFPGAREPELQHPLPRLRRGTDFARAGEGARAVPRFGGDQPQIQRARRQLGPLGERPLHRRMVRRLLPRLSRPGQAHRRKHRNLPCSRRARNAAALSRLLHEPRRRAAGTAGVPDRRTRRRLLPPHGKLRSARQAPLPRRNARQTGAPAARAVRRSPHRRLPPAARRAPLSGSAPARRNRRADQLLGEPRRRQAARRLRHPLRPRRRERRNRLGERDRPHPADLHTRLGAGERTGERTELHLPPGLPPGRFRLAVGMRRLADLRPIRLPLYGGDGFRYDLGPIELAKEPLS